MICQKANNPAKTIKVGIEHQDHRTLLAPPRYSDTKSKQGMKLTLTQQQQVRSMVHSLGFVFLLLLMVMQLIFRITSAQLHKKLKADNVIAEMQVVCHSDSIVLKMNTNNPFNGMLYAKDAPANNNCVTQFNSATNMTFRLPLKSCGTLSAEVDDGIEYFNTIVVQPHMRLMTNQGKGYHIRCKYQTRERTIANTHFNVSAAFLMQNGGPSAPSTPLLATASMPTCTMKIFRSGRDDVAETVKIGDKLIMVIEIDQQDMYGMRVTNCVVRDGLNLAEQQLINDSGCPVDETIMPKFDYSNNYTRAAVAFPAHKFPHTSSVYYQCNVRLCINNGGCDLADCSGGGLNFSTTAPPPTTAASDATTTMAAAASSLSQINGGPRRKRFATKQLPSVASDRQLEQFPMLPEPSELRSSSSARPSDKSDDMSFDVYSGLYVNDIDVGESGSSDANLSANNQNTNQATATNNRSVLPARRSQSAMNNSEQQQLTEELCMTTGRAGLMAVLASLASAGLVFMIACQTGLFSLSTTGNIDLDSSTTLSRRQLQHSQQQHCDMFSPHYLPAANRSHHLSNSTPRQTGNKRYGMGMGLILN